MHATTEIPLFEVHMKIYSSESLRGTLSVPGDKSISHRSIMLGSIAEGDTHVHGFLNGADCISTMNCFKAMGVDLEFSGTDVTVHGVGLHGLKKPSAILDCGNSGTTTRIISGLLAGQSFDTVLTGDASIQKRPMKRVMEPLNLMGARVSSINNNGCAPLSIMGSALHGIDYISPVASAQVKSSILMAGLYANGRTSVSEPYLSRNHTELMLRAFGADITSEGSTAMLNPGRLLYGQEINIPGDISSAAYFIGAGLIVPNSLVTVKNVGINPTRAGIIEVFRRMGAALRLLNVHDETGESVADICAGTSSLHGTVISGAEIPTLIDELPLIAIVASQAHGTTVIKDAAELKVKESDRIALMTEGLRAMGADITATDDGMIINGPAKLHGATINDALDHRIAMSFAIAALVDQGTEPVEIQHPECVSISYPGFFSDLEKISGIHA